MPSGPASQPRLCFTSWLPETSRLGQCNGWTDCALGQKLPWVHSRQRLEHARQGLCDLIHDEGNAEAIAERGVRERTYDKEASHRPAVGTDRAAGFVDIKSNAERRDTAETVLECGAQKRVFGGVGAGSNPGAVDHLVNNNGLVLTRDAIAPDDMNAR